MALENITEIEQSLGIEAGKLAEMITSEEIHKIDLSEKIILDKPIYEERISNIKKESATAAIEIAVKEKRKELGLDFTGKNIDNLLEAFGAKKEAESKIEPEEKFKTLKADFDKLQKNYQEKEIELTTFKSSIEKEKEYNEIKSAFTGSIKGETLVSKSTIFTEAKEKGYSFVKEDGVLVVKGADGQVLKNEQTLSPISISDFASNFSSQYVKKVEGGSGKKDEDDNGKAGTLDAFMKEAEKNNWSNAQTNEEMAKRMKEGTLKL